MEKNKTLVITGTTGYIGSHLLSLLNKHEYEVVITKRVSQNKFKYFNKENKEFTKNKFKNKRIVLIHLATFFSKDNSKRNEIQKSNILFGKELLKDLINFNLQKVIYTNSMFKYYPDENIRSLEYTLSKNIFSEILSDFSKKNSVVLDEIFLDNTFGLQDKRNKVIPNIYNAVLLDKDSPVKNKDIFINLVFVLDVLNRILVSIEDEKGSRTSFISNYSINVNSIYNFLSSIKKFNTLNYDLIIKGKNTYIKNSPVIDLKDVSLTKIEKALVRELKNYENH